MVENDLEIFDKRFRKWNSSVDLTNYSNFDKEAYKYTFSRTIDWQGCINYYRNLPLGAATESVESKIPIDALFFVGNMDPEVNLELVSRSAKYVDRFALQIIPGAGHCPHQEYPHLVNRHIIKFIKDEMSYMTKWSSMIKVVSKQ